MSTTYFSKLKKKICSIDNNKYLGCHPAPSVSSGTSVYGKGTLILEIGVLTKTTS